MIEKIDACIYCGKNMESERASKKFCSDQHRLYYHREIKRGTFVPPNQKEEKQEEDGKKELPKTTEPKRSKIEQLIWESEQEILKQNKK